MATLENPFEKARQKMVAARLEIISQLARFNHDELTRVGTSDEWSALTLAYHIYVTDGMALEMMRRVQEEDNPLIAAPEEEAPRLTREGEPPATLDAVLGGMAARREELFEYLSSLPPEAWERSFRHPQRGQLKFYQMVNLLPEHDRLHAGQLAALKAAITPVQS